MDYAELKKRRQQLDGSAGGGLNGDEAERWPCLCSGLNSYVDDQGERSVIAIQLYLRRGRVAARVTDRDEGLQFFCESPSLQGVFDSIETCLTDPGTDWVRVKSKFS